MNAGNPARWRRPLLGIVEGTMESFRFSTDSARTLKVALGGSHGTDGSPKRRRGRPRTQPVPEEYLPAHLGHGGFSGDAETHQVICNCGAFLAMPRRRGRGRPAKSAELLRRHLEARCGDAATDG